MSFLTMALGVAFPLDQELLARLEGALVDDRLHLVDAVLADRRPLRRRARARLRLGVQLLQGEEPVRH